MLARAVRWLGETTLLSLTLLLLGAASVASGLAQVVREVDPWPLFLSAITAVFAGWLLARSPLPGRIAAPLAFILGAGNSLLRVGQLGGTLLELVRALPDLGAQVWRWPVAGRPDLTPVAHWLTGLAADVGLLLSLFRAWILALARGEPGYDPLAAGLAWHLMLWAVALWAAWSVRRLRRPLLAVAPAGALLASAISYSRHHPESLLLLLGAALPLLALLRYDERRTHWQEEMIGFPVDTGLDVGATVVGMTIALVAAALLAPNVSVRQVVSRAAELFRGASEQVESVASSLGLVQGPGQGAGLSLPGEPELPRRHLIGSGPELSEQVAMVVNVEPAAYQPKTSPRLYWRSHTYDVYTSSGWLSGETELRSYDAREPTGQAPESPYRPVQAEFRVTRQGGGLLYAAGELLAADRDYWVHWRVPQAEGDYFGATIDASRYRANSWVPAPSQEQLRAAGEDYPSWLQDRYLALPEGVPERVFALAGEFSAGASTPYGRARAVEEYLRAIPYTLDLPQPPSGQDVADYFLFDLQRGYCDYYATAMVVLARAAGLPARLVVGYAVGARDEDSSLTVVTAADAHSWAEVYFPGYGWVEFEPTGARPAIERPEETSGDAAPELPVDPFPRAGVLVQAARFWRLGLVLLAVAAVAWWITAEWRLRRRSPAEVSSLLYHRLCRYGSRLRVVSKAGDTPYEFGAALAARVSQLATGRRGEATVAPAILEVGWLTRLYVGMRYGPHPPDTAAKEQALHTWRRLRWRLRLARLWSWR